MSLIDDSYTIRPGDTLSGIARRIGYSMQTLLNANPQIDNPDLIRAGDTITIPSVASGKAVIVTGLEDPGWNYSLANHSLGSGSPAASRCPEQREWMTIKPLRYAVAERASALKLPDSHRMATMPALHQHKYITREVYEHTVYLYQPEGNYLLEAEYINGRPERGRCVFGTAPPEVKAALPLLKQKQGSEAILWLTVAPLTPARLAWLEEDPERIATLGQRFNFSQAASGTGTASSSLSGIQDLLADLQAGDGDTLQWSSQPMDGTLSRDFVLVPYQIQTPDNHFAACLVDAIGITTDLCRQFSALYETVMQSACVSQHPRTMGQLTRHLIDHEEQAAEARVPTYYTNHREGYRIPVPPEDIAKSRARARRSASASLSQYLHIDAMETYLSHYDQAIPQWQQALAIQAQDWLTWLRHEQLDMALSWLDDSDPDQINLKEALIAAMINHIDATDDGVALREQWVEQMLTTLQEAPSPAGSAPGISAHLMLAFGLSKPVILEGSKWLHAFNETTNGPGVDEIARARALLYDSRIPATESTDVLVMSVAGWLAQQSAARHLTRPWEETYHLLCCRYGYQYSRISVRVSEVLYQTELSYSASMAMMTNHSVRAPARLAVTGTLALYDLSEETPASGKTVGRVAQYLENHSRFWARQFIGRGLLDEPSSLMRAYRATEQVFDTPLKNGTVGLLWLVQVYNAFQVAGQLEKSNVWKASYLTVNAFVSVLNSSLAGVDQFYGARFGQPGSQKVFTQYMQGEGAELVGKHLSGALRSGLEQMSTLTEAKIEQFEKLGKRITRLVRGSFKSLPVIGVLLSLTGSAYQLAEDRQAGQNGWVVTLSGAALLTNSAALMFAAAGLFPVGAPVAAVIGVVLLVTTLGIELLRALLTDSEAQLLVKGSLWGTGEYRYLPVLAQSSTSQRLAAFQSTEPGAELAVAMQREMAAFCDFLFKPQGMVRDFFRHDDLSRYTLELLLPGYLPMVSDISLSLSGLSGTGEALLVSHPLDDRWQLNRVNARLTLHKRHTARLTFDIDEQALGQNYRQLILALDYHTPGGYPVTLSYPKIVVDDNKQWLWLFPADVEVTPFKRETTHEPD